jgi:hypothetical protein
MQPSNQMIPEPAIYQELRAPKCRCGATKRPGRTFCIGCYTMLPREIQNLLYQRNGYLETYRKAVVILDRSSE